MMETVIRVAIIYLFLMIGLRIIGKREFAELSALELVSLLMIPELVSNALQREAMSVANGLIGVATLFTLVFLTSVAMHLSSRAEKVIAGSPVVLVHHGQLIVDNMNRERVTPDEIYGSMHMSGLDQLHQVRWAILDSDGKIAIVPEAPSQQIEESSVRKAEGSSKGG
jgi:uncharacterized membrane protein YcaP (DUF421 family)